LRDNINKLQDQIKSMQDLIDAVTKENKGLGDQLKKLNDQFEKLRDPTSRGKWMEGLSFVFKIVLGLGVLITCAIGVKSLLDYLNNLAHAMSGCWLADEYGTYKIEALTCKQADIDHMGGYTLAGICNDASNCKSGEWVPVKQIGCTCCSDGGLPFPGEYNADADTGNNPCTSTGCKTQGNPNCPIKQNIFRAKQEGIELGRWVRGEPLIKGLGDTTIACPDADQCIVKKEACAGDLNQGDCSAWCSPSILYLASGQTVSCEKAGLGDALAHLFDNFWKGLSADLGPFLKILLYIGIGVIGLIILAYGLKWVFHAFSEKSAN
jgi:hypothetical protein